MKLRKPCANCPWRKDAPASHWDEQHFIDIWSHCQDDGMHVMLCHKATKLPEAERSKLVCQGWVRVMGFDAIGVRIAAMTGKVSVDEVNDVSGQKLFASFAEMMEANGIEVPERNRFQLLSFEAKRWNTEVGLVTIFVIATACLAESPAILTSALRDISTLRFLMAARTP